MFAPLPAVQQEPRIAATGVFEGVAENGHPIEGAFLACTLWLADAFVLAGEFEKAKTLFSRVVGVANDLGLLAEEFDPVAGRQTGNFPQALTHMALVNTARLLSIPEADAKRATARGESISMPCAASPPSTFCHENVATSSFIQSSGCANAADVAS